MRFRNRQEAGYLLARALEKYKDADVVVYALPRGGVAVGIEIATHLHAPLDLIIPRKIGHPLHPEYAICAVTEEGFLVCNEEEIAHVDQGWLRTAVAQEQAEAKRRRLTYLSDRPAISAESRTAIVTDDGVATGLTIIAAIQEVRDRHPQKIVLAIPVVPKGIAEELRKHVDELVALEIPEVYLGAVGAYYEEFDQVSDDEVIEALRRLDTDKGEEPHA
jgi:putative phosphoribosyl transferase